MNVDGMALQIPDDGTDPSVVAAIGKAVENGTAVLLSGRADKIHPALLKLVGAQLADDDGDGGKTPAVPAARGVNASLAIQPGWATAAKSQVLSLSSRVGVSATSVRKTHIFCEPS
eukprot:COSAG06_NODE_848_length_11971_cov_10.199882_17_plen_116_part_00